MKKAVSRAKHSTTAKPLILLGLQAIHINVFKRIRHVILLILGHIIRESYISIKQYKSQEINSHFRPQKIENDSIQLKNFARSLLAKWQQAVYLLSSISSTDFTISLAILSIISFSACPYR